MLKGVDMGMWSFTCHMGSQLLHTVIRHLMQVNMSHLNLSQAGEYLICLPQRDARLS